MLGRAKGSFSFKRKKKETAQPPPVTEPVKQPAMEAPVEPVAKSEASPASPPPASPPPPSPPPPPKLDPIASLPPDIIQHLTGFLPVRDVLSWRRVCKTWKNMLVNPSLSVFWRRAAEYAGAPMCWAKKLQPNYSTVDGIFHQVRHYTDHIARIRPKVKVLTGVYPFESTIRCKYAGKGYFVRTLDSQSLEESETVIGELCPHRRIIKRIASIKGRHYGEVNYATVFANNIVWQTVEGVWLRYSLETGMSSRLFDDQFKTEHERIGFCRHCLFLIIGKTESIRYDYHWNLNFFKVEEKGVIKAKHVPVIPIIITAATPRPVNPLLITDDGCKTHRLVVQGGTGGCVFLVTHDSEEMTIELSKKPLAILNPYYDLQIAVMVVTTCSNYYISADEKFVALLASIIYPYNTKLILYFFDLKTYERRVVVRINWPEGFDDCRLLAASELYAVITTGKSIKIVHCHSGQIISSTDPLPKGLPMVNQFKKLTYMGTEGIHGEEFLGDVTGKLGLTVFYRWGMGNLHAVFYDPFPPCLAMLENRHGDSDSDND